MKYSCDKNIVDIKNEYTSFLVNIMIPLIYEGIVNIYNKAKETEKQIVSAIKSNPKKAKEENIENPGVLVLFQHYLKGVKNLSEYKIDQETKRIKSASKCADYFDNLVRAVIKSHIILLTYNASEKNCPIIDMRYHEKVSIPHFVHLCYIENARIFYNYPEIFYDDDGKIHPFELKKNQRESFSLIKIGITEAIRKMLPLKVILDEYLKTDYINCKKKTNNDIKSSNNDDNLLEDTRSVYTSGKSIETTVVSGVSENKAGDNKQNNAEYEYEEFGDKNDDANDINISINKQINSSNNANNTNNKVSTTNINNEEYVKMGSIVGMNKNGDGGDKSGK